MAYLVNDQRFYKPQDGPTIQQVKNWLCLAQLHAEIADWVDFIAVHELFGHREGEPVTEADLLREMRMIVPVPEEPWDGGPDNEVLDEFVVAAAMKQHGFVMENIDVRVKRRKRRNRDEFEYYIRFTPHDLPDVELDDT